MPPTGWHLPPGDGEDGARNAKKAKGGGGGKTLSSRRVYKGLACRRARSRQRNHPLFRSFHPFTPPSILCATRLFGLRKRARTGFWLPVWFSELARAFLPNRMGKLEVERGRRRKRRREGSPVRLSSSELRLPVYSDGGLFYMFRLVGVVEARNA